MTTLEIVSALDAQIARLQRAKSILQGISTNGKRGPGRTTTAPVSLLLSAKPSKPRAMSAEGRAKIAAAQKARWASQKQVSETATPTKAVPPTKKVQAKAAKKTAAKK